MSVREKMEENRPIVIGAAGALILIAVIFIAIQLFGGGRGDDQLASPNKVFFTVDDGKTWFADSADNLSPFTKDGKQAYQAIVLTCDGGSTKFVSYLMRYTSKLRQKLEASQKQPANRPTGDEVAEGTEVKAPGTGEKGWIKQSSADMSKISAPCLKGDPKNIEAVRP